MSYTMENFKTKKALKQAVQDGQKVTCYNPGLGPSLTGYTGTVYLEGPHYPAPHTWYATGQMQDGVLVKVK